VEGALPCGGARRGGHTVPTGDEPTVRLESAKGVHPQLHAGEQQADPGQVHGGRIPITYV